MYSSSILIFTAEVHPARTLLIFRHMKSMSCQLSNAFIFGGRNGHHRNSQHIFHLINADGPAVSSHLIHHIERQHHGHIQLHQLQSQIKVPLNIGGIYNINNPFGVFVQNERPGHHFLAGIGRHRINPRKVCDQGIAVSFDYAVFPVHSDTGKIPHMLICPCQLVKQCGFSAILIPCQGKRQNHVICQGSFCCLLMIFSTLSQTWMRRMGFCYFASIKLFWFIIPDPFNLYLLGISYPQSQFISMEHKFHRVSQRRIFHQHNI